MGSSKPKGEQHSGVCDEGASDEEASDEEAAAYNLALDDGGRK